MWNVRLGIDIYGRTPDNRVDYAGGKRTEEAFVSLNTLAPVTYIEEGLFGSLAIPKNAHTGRWYCTSKYVGRESSGFYWVTANLAIGEADSYQVWRGPNGRPLANPVGLFFDSASSTDPFLMLYDFAPASFDADKVRSGGNAVLDRSPIPISSTWIIWQPVYKA